MLISDATRVGHERFLDLLESAWEAGLPMLQIREPALPTETLRILVEAIVEAAPSNRHILISRRTELARELQLDGVHLGGGAPSRIATARAELPEGCLVGYSAHGLDELGPASSFGGDYVTYSPIFGALSKRHPLPAVGTDGLRAACDTSELPVYALGGVTPDRVSEVKATGAVGVAVIGAVVDAADPGERGREFLSRWSS